VKVIYILSDRNFVMSMKPHKNAYYQAFSAVNRKFVAIARQTSKASPLDGEILEFETTWGTLEGVKQRIKRFVKTYS